MFQEAHLWPLALGILLFTGLYLFLYWRKLRSLPSKVFLQNPKAPLWKTVFLSLSALFLSIALLSPTWGKGKRKVEASSGNVIFLLDLSRSMYAFDLPPSRLEVSKALIRRIVRNSPGDRFALVGFAGEGRIFAPFTSSEEGFLKILFFLSPEALKQGSIPEEGLKEVGVLLKRSSGLKTLVIITDGEFFSRGWKEAALRVATSGINTFVVGVGTPQGERIRLPDGGFKTYKGTPVITKMRVENLEELSRLLSARLLLLNETPLEEAARRISSSIRRKSRFRFITYPIPRGYLFAFLFFLAGLGFLRWRWV